MVALQDRAIPGLIVVVIIALVAQIGEQIVPWLPPAVIALGIGFVLRQALPSEQVATLLPGLRWTLRWVLRTGIVLLGATVSLSALADAGVTTLGLILICASTALAASFALSRLAGIPLRTGALIAAGTAICGATAIVTVSPLINADEDEIGYAISTIFTFNVVAILVFPLIGHALGLPQVAFGTWAGTSINDTSAVVATGFAYGTTAAATATVVKLARTILLIPLAVAYTLAASRRSTPDASRSVAVAAAAAIPWFVLAFAALAAINTAGLIPADISRLAGDISRFLISAVLAAVGLNLSVTSIRRLGPRPLAVGLAAATLVAVLSLLLIAGLSEVPR